MGTKREDVEDKRVLNLAAEVADATDKLVPRLLLQLQDILDSYPQGSTELIKAKDDIWSLDLLEVLSLCLKQEFAKQLNGWEMAAKLSTILSQCCIGLDPSDSHQFYGIFLPNAIEVLLALASKLQTRYNKTSTVLEDTRKNLLECYRTVLDSVSILFSGHEFLTLEVCKNPWVLQLLMTEDVQTSLGIMATIMSACRMKLGLFGSLDEKVVHQLLDELIYKLSASTDAEVAGGSTRTLLVICDSHPPMVELFCTRYRGLRPLLNKWEGKGFGRDLRKLQLLLDAGSMREAQEERFHQAASQIQALWKSYSTRKRLKSADKAMGKFHRSFRLKKETEEKRKEDAKLRSELEHVLLRRRKKAMRELREKQLHALKILPASEVPKHLANQQTRAAIRIQALWRGVNCRKGSSLREETVKRARATIVIQRGVRKWLDRIGKHRREPPKWQRPPGLTDERRVELQAKVVEWRELHQVEAQARDQQLDLHNKVQDLLRQNAIRSRLTRKTEQHRHALLARLELDSNLLSDSPSLCEVSEKDIENFTSRSVPIATKARHNHTEELRLLNQPWWRKLGDEYQDQKYEEENDSWKMF